MQPIAEIRIAMMPNGSCQIACNCAVDPLALFHALGATVQHFSAELMKKKAGNIEIPPAEVADQLLKGI